MPIPFARLGRLLLTVSGACILMDFARAAPATPAPSVTSAKSPRIIVTGFGPFAGRPVNASSLLAKAIAAHHPEWTVRALEIPVLWGEPERVLQAVSAEPWDLWIAFGEGGAGAFSIETRADNQRGNGKDNDRKTPPTPLIQEHGPAQLTLDAQAPALAQKITDLGFAARVSKSAGRYLCEEMLYTLLYAQQQTPARKVLFIHVPPYGQPLQTTASPDRASVSFDDSTIDQVAARIGPALVDFLNAPAK